MPKNSEISDTPTAPSRSCLLAMTSRGASASCELLRMRSKAALLSAKRAGLAASTTKMTAWDSA
eukprot:1144734-Pelagomonas_calceolata.AAC.1